MVMSLVNLREMSNRYGSNPEYVLAGGGNTSFKDGGYLYIKGSGTSLATIEESGFVKLSREKLDTIFHTTYPDDAGSRESEVLKDMLNARAEGETKRPSVETLLHNVYPFSYVLHLHPAAVNGLTCGKNGADAFAGMFASDGIWIEPIMPGFILAQRVREKIAGFRKTASKLPSFIFIENHGVFIGADTVKQIDSRFSDMMERIRPALKSAPDFSPCDFDRRKAVAVAPALRFLAGGGTPGIAVFHTNREIMKFTSSEAAFGLIRPAFTPDHLVYCRAHGLYIESDHSEDIYAELAAKTAEYRKTYHTYPKIVGVKNLGFYAFGRTKKEADIAADVFLDAAKIAVYASNFGGGKPMPADLAEAITGWEAERYRQSVSFSGGAEKRLRGKIAIVTGGAQGFGKGIAEKMASEGAYVGVADLNGEGAAQNADALNQAYGRGTAVGIRANVSEEAEIRGMIEQVVLRYGGLDILVNNAGIVHAGSLDDMDLSSFELVTKINYTSYFLCVRAASEIMKIQNRFSGNYYMDIIQINSKSGLVGSNRNFAYAGSKFGDIGLTQSFALELCPYHIKVNSVCPGNFLGGPLWCDPERGLFVQYLKAGKVPGAKTVNDVRRYYESKVPMNRGCEIRDVACAINYIVEQEYETGQAIPVTGGQVMLN